MGSGISWAVHIAFSFNQMTSIFNVIYILWGKMCCIRFSLKEAFCFVLLSFKNHCFKRSKLPVNSPKGPVCLSMMMSERLQEPVLCWPKGRHGSINVSSSCLPMSQSLYMLWQIQLIASSIFSTLIFNFYRIGTGHEKEHPSDTN